VPLAVPRPKHTKPVLSARSFPQVLVCSLAGFGSNRAAEADSALVSAASPRTAAVPGDGRGGLRHACSKPGERISV
jgi:hypothetical protein